jgi:hypothetical protein
VKAMVNLPENLDGYPVIVRIVGPIKIQQKKSGF